MVGWVLWYLGGICLGGKEGVGMRKGFMYRGGRDRHAGCRRLCRACFVWMSVYFKRIYINYICVCVCVCVCVLDAPSLRQHVTCGRLTPRCFAPALTTI